MAHTEAGGGQVGGESKQRFLCRSLKHLSLRLSTGIGQSENISKSKLYCKFRPGGIQGARHPKIRGKEHWGTTLWALQKLHALQRQFQWSLLTPCGIPTSKLRFAQRCPSNICQRTVYPLVRMDQARGWVRFTPMCWFHRQDSCNQVSHTWLRRLIVSRLHGLLD